METIVISVGGSLIAPQSGVDTDFLANLRECLSEQIATRDVRFVLIAGGGSTARMYQHAAAEITKLSAHDLDWLGIHATRLNGHLLRTILSDIAYPKMLTNPDEVLDVPEDARVIVASGYRPGASTDLRAVQIAVHTGGTRVVNLSNTDYVYTDDPRENSEATPIRAISWKDFRALIPHDWEPGLSSPFDPVAAAEAESNGVEVACINGAHLDRLTAYLEGEPFVGTTLGV